jgi:DNA-binding response OmpR family regulator
MVALSRTAAPLPVRTATVLVVDENPALRQTVQAMLAASAYSCIGAADSLSALCMVVEQQPQVVLLDADCGPLQPWQFAQLLQHNPGQTPTRLIYTSIRDDVIERARAAAASVDSFLAKPFTTEDLLAALTSKLASAA